MRDPDSEQLAEWTASEGLETPFAETAYEEPRPSGESGPALFSETVTPFAEIPLGESSQSETDRMIAEALSELRDEAFNEALAQLAEQTEQEVSDHFVGEATSFPAERERFADARLAEVRYEAEQYFDNLEQGLAGLDVSSLSEDRLGEVLERYDPETPNLTPAGEEFIGGLVRKAKGAIKHVINTAKKIGSLASPFIGPLLKKLKGLIRPLLRRVLSFAIGRLPAPLRPVARKLATKLTSEAETLEALEGLDMEEEQQEGEMSPANLTDVEALAEEFDYAIAEATLGETAYEQEEEASLGESDHEAEGSGQLLALAEARSELIDRLGEAQSGENLAPAIENFVPALLGALRLGISLIGRPKVVGFLAGYLNQLIKKWVEPQTSGALSNAIVDAGLRLMTLEAEEESSGESNEDREAAHVALATVVEDTVRRLAEHEDYVFEDETLMQLAAADSFAEAVASHFPPRYVRSDLQRAPSLGGTFVARRPRNIRAYRKYSRVPQVDITPQIADSLRTFGGATLGSALRAQGVELPTRARMHIFQAAPGSTLGAIGRLDRGLSGSGGRVPPSSFHPLTPAAAGTLLREPRLGAPVPRAFLRSPHRIAAGQRVFVLQPIGARTGLGALAARSGLVSQAAATHAWLRVHYRQARITVGIYFSEADAQAIAQAIRKGGTGTALLKAIGAAVQHIGLSGHPRRIQREEREEFEELAGSFGRRLPRLAAMFLRKQIGRWVLPALSKWANANSEAFLRAAAHPDDGVTIRAHLSGVPGFDLLRRLAAGQAGGADIARLRGIMKGVPAVAITISPGKRRK